jgi:hypothetical protein
MGVAITVLTALFSILNYERGRDTLFFAVGMAAYGTINVLGNTVQERNWESLPYIIMTAAACLVILTALFREANMMEDG